MQPPEAWGIPSMRRLAQESSDVTPSDGPGCLQALGRFNRKSRRERLGSSALRDNLDREIPDVSRNIARAGVLKDEFIVLKERDIATGNVACSAKNRRLAENQACPWQQTMANNQRVT